MRIAVRKSVNRPRNGYIAEYKLRKFLITNEYCDCGQFFSPWLKNIAKVAIFKIDESSGVFRRRRGGKLWKMLAS